MRLRMWVVVIACSLATREASAQQFSRSTPCPSTHSFDMTVSKSYSHNAQFYVNSIDFTYGFGTFGILGVYEEATSGTYYFDDIRSSNGPFVLDDPTISSQCVLHGQYGPPIQDTLFTTIVTSDSFGGTVQPVYNGDEDVETEEESETCYYRVAADEYGMPLTDDNGNYFILEELGCLMQ